MLLTCFIPKSRVFPILEKTRDFGMEHVDFIDFMLKSTFCQLFIDGSLTVHS